MAKPFLKWVGGKGQLIDQILHLIPKQINRYYEPFIGGGAILFALLNEVEQGKRTIKHFQLSDKNATLISLYKRVKTDPETLITHLDKFSKQYSRNDMEGKKKMYYRLRDRFNKASPSPMRDALFLFLNKTGFRGLHRVGPRGFNVSFGHYTNPGICEPERIRAVSRLLRKYRVKIIHASFDKAVKTAIRGDFVYLDPPYYPVKEGSFTMYHSNGFYDKNHDLLYETCLSLNRKHVGWLMSNSDVKPIRQQYKQFRKKKITAKRKIDRNNPDSVAGELLIFNY